MKSHSFQIAAVAIVAMFILTISVVFSIESRKLSVNTDVVSNDAQYSFNPNDITALVKNSPNIFVGQVQARLDNKKVGEFESPAYQVRVLSNLKGNTANTVTVVVVDVGYRNNQTYITQGDMSSPSSKSLNDYLLNPGSTYLFTTRYSAAKDVYGIEFYGLDRTLLTNQSSLTGVQLNALLQNSSRASQIKTVITETQK